MTAAWTLDFIFEALAAVGLTFFCPEQLQRTKPCPPELDSTFSACLKLMVFVLSTSCSVSRAWETDIELITRIFSFENPTFHANCLLASAILRLSFNIYKGENMNGHRNIFTVTAAVFKLGARFLDTFLQVRRYWIKIDSAVNLGETPSSGFRAVCPVGDTTEEDRWVDLLCCSPHCDAAESCLSFTKFQLLVILESLRPRIVCYVILIGQASPKIS